MTNQAILRSTTSKLNFSSTTPVAMTAKSARGRKIQVLTKARYLHFKKVVPRLSSESGCTAKIQNRIMHL